MKIAPKSHPYFLIEAPESGELEITMTTPVPCNIATEFILKIEKTEENKDEYVFRTKTEKEVKFQIRIPENGYYALKIYGLPLGHKSEGFPMT